MGHVLAVTAVGGTHGDSLRGWHMKGETSGSAFRDIVRVQAGDVRPLCSHVPMKEMNM